MDVNKLSQELDELRRKRIETKQRLDSLSGGRGRGGAAAFPGPGGRGPGIAASRLGPPRLGDAPSGGSDRWQPSEGPGAPPQRTSVFERLGNGSGSGDAGPRGRDRDSAGREPVGAPPLGRTGSGSGAWGRMSSREGPGFLDRDGAARFRRGNNSSFEDIIAQDRTRSDPPAAAGPSTSRKRLLSTVVVDGEQRVPSAAAAAAIDDGGRRRSSSGAAGADEGERGRDDEDAGGERPAKRQARPEDLKRGRRLFGSLLMGTLQRFKSEDKEFQASEAAQKRQEAARKAEERAEAEAQRLRDLAREERNAARDKELGALFEINLEADTKLLEIRVAKKIARMELVAGTLGTKAEAVPQLRWMPKVHNAATEAALAQERQLFEEWREQQLQQLEVDKQGLAQRAAERRQQALQRAAERREQARVRRQQQEQQQDGAGTAGGQEGSPHADEEGEVEEEGVRRELEGGELDATVHEEGEAAENEAPARAEEPARHEGLRRGDIRRRSRSSSRSSGSRSSRSSRSRSTSRNRSSSRSRSSDSSESESDSSRERGRRGGGPRRRASDKPSKMGED